MLTGIAIGLIIACGYPIICSIFADVVQNGTYFDWDGYFPVGVCFVLASGAIGFLVGGV